MKAHIKAILTGLSEKPGCYLMKSKQENIIYVGKAKNLRKRVSSYFNKVHNNKTQLLVKEVCDIETIITRNEKESLLLELNLIKKHRPKYNVIFMDDKTYPYIALTKEKHPKIKVVRNTKSKNAYYFGPYPNGSAAYDTFNLINKLFKLRKCNKLPKKECLYFHINQCLAPCINNIETKEYEVIERDIKSFLRGNIGDILNELESKMNYHAECLNFEKALEIKNLIEAIQLTTNKQIVSKNDNKSRDFIGVHYNDDYLAIQILMMRNGLLIERKQELIELVDDVQNTLDSYLMQYYELNVQADFIYFDDRYLSNEIKDSLNNIVIPIKGDYKKLLCLAFSNAKKALDEKYSNVINNNDKLKEALEQLKTILSINNDIHRIEAFDNSSLNGSNSIGAMVVFENGNPIKSEYRKFKINNLDIKDDYHFMKEVLYRRYYRVLVEKLKQTDLIIVDGAKLQIKAAKEIISSFNLDITIIGLVKDDKHKTNIIMDSNYNTYIIDKQSELFFLLTRIQDEVHNYAIKYHISLRSKRMFLSELDDIDGLGDIRRKKLLNYFKSVDSLKKASLEDIEKIIPKKIANNVYNKLHNK